MKRSEALKKAYQQGHVHIRKVNLKYITIYDACYNNTIPIYIAENYMRCLTWHDRQFPKNLHQRITARAINSAFHLLN